MTKAELIDKINETTDEGEETIGCVLDALAESVGEALGEGQTVDLAPLGRFVPRQEAAHEGHNPADGTPVEVPAQVRILFHPSGDLRAAANGAEEEGE